MDFVAVPAGTARVAALALRGADPSLSFATADSFNTTLGDTLCAVPGAPGRMEAAYSNVAAELVGALFTNDAAVLDSATILSVINPAKLRAVWLRLVADGLDDAASLSGSRFRYERDNVLAGLDYTALAVGYLVTAADLFLTQASAGALGGAATSIASRSWMLSGSPRAGLKHPAASAASSVVMACTDSRPSSTVCSDGSDSVSSSKRRHTTSRKACPPLPAPIAPARLQRSDQS